MIGVILPRCSPRFPYKSALINMILSCPLSASKGILGKGPSHETVVYAALHRPRHDKNGQRQQQTQIKVRRAKSRGTYMQTSSSRISRPCQGCLMRLRRLAVSPGLAAGIEAQHHITPMEAQMAKNLGIFVLACNEYSSFTQKPIYQVTSGIPTSP